MRDLTSRREARDGGHARVRLWAGVAGAKARVGQCWRLLPKGSNKTTRIPQEFGYEITTRGLTKQVFFRSVLVSATQMLGRIQFKK